MDMSKTSQTDAVSGLKQFRELQDIKELVRIQRGAPENLPPSNEFMFLIKLKISFSPKCAYW